MSIVAPISASGVVVPVVVGVASGDRPTALQAVAIPLIFAGVILASREVHESDEQASSSRTSIALALFAALAFGVYFSITDAVAEDSVLWLLLLGRGISVVLLGAALAVTRTPLRIRGRRDLGLVAMVGGLDLLATGLYGVANTEGLLSIVAVVGALYPVATVLLARVVLRERLRPSQAAGVALAVAGVAAVAGG
jgi:drug/metabolite transporter (DMT)-like permease